MVLVAAILALIGGVMLTAGGERRQGPIACVVGVILMLMVFVSRH
jgi:hypothetical protein